jgi:hypothetical protein
MYVRMTHDAIGIDPPIRLSCSGPFGYFLADLTVMGRAGQGRPGQAHATPTAWTRKAYSTTTLQFRYYNPSRFKGITYWILYRLAFFGAL